VYAVGPGEEEFEIREGVFVGREGTMDANGKILRTNCDSSFEVLLCCLHTLRMATIGVRLGVYNRVDGRFRVA
jgi:hypothetical protein